MSATPHAPVPPGLDAPLPMTLPRLADKKRLGEPIVMVTAYDYPSAQVAEEAGVDVVLVGDSGAMTVLGYPSTVPVSTDEMLMLTAAVRRGLEDPAARRRPAVRLLRGLRRSGDRDRPTVRQGGGRDAVKIERGGTSVQRALAIVEAGIPVMGHVGLTPQTATALGGHRAQGRSADQALAVAHDAVALQQAGCFAIVLEAIPAAVTAALMSHMEIPVIGIGAGDATDGQVLVFHDLLGIYDGHVARFVKRYADVARTWSRASPQYADDVRSRRFPAPEHFYSIDEQELARFTAGF